MTEEQGNQPAEGETEEVKAPEVTDAAAAPVQAEPEAAETTDGPQEEAHDGVASEEPTVDALAPAVVEPEPHPAFFSEQRDPYLGPSGQARARREFREKHRNR